MNAAEDLAALADLCGILPHYFDLQGGERITSPETQKALLAANGIDVSSDAAIHHSLNALRHEIDERWFPEEIIVESGVTAPQNFGLGATWQIRLDGEDDVVAEGQPCDFITVPALASGVYSLTATASGRTETVTVLAAPKRLPTIQSLTGLDRLWGLNLALYGLRSDRNTGIGDFEDLARIAELAAGNGAGFFGINPLHSMGYCDLDAISPYSPSHRGFLNTAYIALDRIPGLTGASDFGAFEGIRKAANVQYQGHKAAHNQMLEGLFSEFDAEAPADIKSDFATFKARGGSELQDFARFETLTETHGTNWKEWPAEPGNESAARVEFHMWLQWVAATQLATAQTRV